jgi:hypothetical protein
VVGDGPAGTRYSVEQVTWLLASHLKLVGRPLLAPITGESDADRASRPYAAPFVALARDVAADPCSTCADLAARRLFERSWDAFVGLPSRLSAEAPARGSADPAPGNLREGIRST